MKDEISSNQYGHPAASSINPPAADADCTSGDTAILQQELAKEKDAYLRLAADFDNFRKRTRRDSEQQAAAEKDSFIRDLLPVVDNLDRALANKESTSYEQLHQGVEMTLQQLSGLLHSNSIHPIEAVGQLFDPHTHEALFVANDPSQPDHSVLEVIQRGYHRGEKIFRPAKVIVNSLGHSPPS